jgi:tetratricopeptide (TPR) repeat protein
VADSRIDDLRRRLERDPGSRLFAQLAEEYRKAGSHADAIRVARTGLAQHPSYPSARLTLGRALLESGDPGGARAELETVLREAPDNILASRFLGQALEALGELEPALAQLQKTLKMAPGDRQLERQVVALESRLRSPQPPSPPPVEPALDSAAAWQVTPPGVRPMSPAPPEAEGSELPPTIRIHPPAEQAPRGWRAPAPPPLPSTAAPPAAPKSAPPSPAPPPPPTLGQTSPLRAAPPPAPPPAAAAVAPAPGPAPPAAEDSDVAPTLPTAKPPGFGLADEAAAPTLPPRVVAAEETVFEAEAPPAPPSAPAEEPAGAATRAAGEVTSPAGTPFSSSTLAELYLRQGLVDRAVEIYRQVVTEEPRNERARARLAEIESARPTSEARAARRAALERMIAGLEALLAVVRRR